jgi:hypothetical protein
MASLLHTEFYHNPDGVLIVKFCFACANSHLLSYVSPAHTGFLKRRITINASGILVSGSLLTSREAVIISFTQSLSNFPIKQRQKNRFTAPLGGRRGNTTVR